MWKGGGSQVDPMLAVGVIGLVLTGLILVVAILVGRDKLSPYWQGFRLSVMSGVRRLGRALKGLYVGVLSRLAGPVRDQLAIVLLARCEQGTMIFSGEVGEFSEHPYRRWSRSVACEHYPDWPRMPPAKWLWIRDKPTNEEARAGQEVRHRREFWLLRDPETVRLAKLRLRVDDVADVFVNREYLGRFRGWELHEVDIANCLRRGKNRLFMGILNDAIMGSTGDSNPSGVVYDVKIA